MNKGSRYRRNRRKKRIKAIIVISAISITALFVIFMAVGLSLAEKPKPSENAVHEQAQSDVDEGLPSAPTVNAYPLPLLEDGSSFSSRLSSLHEDANAVCISLNSPNGELLFKSSVASHFSTLLVKGDASSLSRSHELIEGEDLYSTALLYMASPSNDASSPVNEVYSSIWGAIACEAVQEGVDDVLLLPDDSFDNVDKLCAIAENLRLSEKNAVIGLGIPKSILESEDSVNLISKLSKSFSYLAINLTELKPEDELTLSERIEEELKDLQLQIMYHGMRVLLPKGASAEEQTSLIEVVKKYNIDNWQISPN